MISQPELLTDIGGVHGAAKRRRQPALRPLARRLLDQIEHAQDHSLLLGAILAVIDHEFGLDVVVRDQLIAALSRSLYDLRMPLAQGAVDGAARRHFGLV